MNAMVEKDLFGEVIKPKASSILAQRFGVPPFTILNSREGNWQERKRNWQSIGIKSELGRDGLGDSCATPMDYFSGGKTIAGDSGSIFDPVLCETIYTWFSPAGGSVIDPFSGGSVRGVVASVLGRHYTGCDLRAEQVEANRVQGLEICEPDFMPTWHHGDSKEIGTIAPGEYDFLFSCPPYGSLEVYSDDPRDISNMELPAFRQAYSTIIAEASKLLKQDRFACFVVGDYRDAKGNYCNFVSDTIAAFQAAGLHLYNEAILINCVGTAAIRATRQFDGGRKLCKTHQNVLVFVKGDGKRATQHLHGSAAAQMPAGGTHD